MRAHVRAPGSSSEGPAVVVVVASSSRRRAAARKTTFSTMKYRYHLSCLPSQVKSPHSLAHLETLTYFTKDPHNLHFQSPRRRVVVASSSLRRHRRVVVASPPRRVVAASSPLYPHLYPRPILTVVVPASSSPLPAPSRFGGNIGPTFWVTRLCVAVVVVAPSSSSLRRRRFVAHPPAHSRLGHPFVGAPSSPLSSLPPRKVQALVVAASWSPRRRVVAPCRRHIVAVPASLSSPLSSPQVLSPRRRSPRRPRRHPRAGCTSAVRLDRFIR